MNDKTQTVRVTQAVYRRLREVSFRTGRKITELVDAAVVEKYGYAENRQEHPREPSR